MKNTIQIQNQLYSYENKAKLVKSESEDLAWLNELTIVREGFEKHPLMIHFLAKDDYYMGNTLIVEMVDEVSLDNAELIEKIIDFALKNDWNPSEKRMEIGAGMNMLRSLGYEIDTIDTAVKRNIHEYLIRHSEI